MTFWAISSISALILGTSPVFNASTIFWSQGLSAPPGHMPPISHHGRPHGVDERVRRITRNVLERMVG